MPEPGERQTETGTADDEAALVARARHDRHAFAPLYRRYVDSVYRYCYARLGDRDAAEDATSQVFAKALSALPSQRPDRSFRAWLFAIARNAVVDQHRARRPDRPLTEADDPVDAGPSPEDLALGADEGAAVRALLGRLPPDQRRVVELRLAGLSGAEVAAALGRSPGAVKIAQVRAYARLRDLLGGAEAPASATPPAGEKKEVRRGASRG